MKILKPRTDWRVGFVSRWWAAKFLQILSLVFKVKALNYKAEKHLKEEEIYLVPVQSPSHLLIKLIAIVGNVPAGHEQK